MARSKTDPTDIYNRPSEATPIDDLTPHPRNYRQHRDDQIAHIVQSIKDHGFYRNVVVAKDNTILAGHGVVLAARELNITEIPVVRIDCEPDSPQALKLLAADNYIQHLAMDDDRMLTDLLKEVAESDVLLGTGFDDCSLAAYAMITRPMDEIADLNAALEWANAGMPEFVPAADIAEFADQAKLVVVFPSEEHRQRWVEQTTAADPEFMMSNSHSGTLSARWPKSESHDREDIMSVKFEVGIDGIDD